MRVRCTECNKRHYFRNKRGNRLADQKCDCGGHLELIRGLVKISGKHPFDEILTMTSTANGQEFFYADKNKKGEIFIFHNGYFHPITNPQILQL